MNIHFSIWKEKTAKYLKALRSGCHPKEIINKISEELLSHYAGKYLIDAYELYQRLMELSTRPAKRHCRTTSATTRS